ncbi:MAG TPA: hypothetical protein PLP27_02950 [Crocinitomicaceae bacterium]|nr:hypothetical protein [Crocinitomicaceae bacterium]
MKHKLLSLIGLIQATTIMAQTPPLGTPPAGTTAAQAQAAWYRGGNNPLFTNPPDANIFGTLWNSPIYTKTNAVNRSKLNGNVNYTVGGYNSAKNGYMLIGIDN